MFFRAFGESNRGAVKESNEDAFALCEREHSFLAVVADGVSCQGHGDEASKICCETFAGMAAKAPTHAFDTTEKIESFLHKALDRANLEVLAFDRQSGVEAETTVCALVLAGNRAGIVHAGDSRIYRLRGNRLSLRTVDHTLSEKYLAEHGCFPVEREKLSSMLYRAVGSKETISGDFKFGNILPGDRFLLCSDGIYREIDFDVIEAILAGSDSPHRAVDQLMRSGFLGGAHDNMTAVAVFCEEEK